MTTNKPEVTSKETVTLDQSGAVMTIDQDGLSMPADYSFACVNDYIHSVDRHFEELQWLALGMSNEIETLRKAVAAVEDLMDNSSGVSGLHLNGDVAPWSDLRQGGHLEEWLIDFDSAL